MINIKPDITDILQQLGERLKEARLARNESQEIFAARMGLTRQSFSKMEKGNASVPIASWLAASDILGLLDTWQNVLAERKNLFEQLEHQQKKRKRASGKRAGDK